MQKPQAANGLREFAETCFGAMDRVLLGRSAWTLLAVARCVPFRREKFLRFCQDAFLLKQASYEIEFIHRLLRDYFALRELLPRVSGEQTARLRAIESLGYQGEAALDVLVELAGDHNSTVRATALSAIARIPSPITFKCIEHHVNDRVPAVRQSVIRGLSLLREDDYDRIMTGMVPIGDGSEI